MLLLMKRMKDDDDGQDDDYDDDDHQHQYDHHHRRHFQYTNNHPSVRASRELKIDDQNQMLLREISGETFTLLKFEVPTGYTAGINPGQHVKVHAPGAEFFGTRHSFCSESPFSSGNEHLSKRNQSRYPTCRRATKTGTRRQIWRSLSRSSAAWHPLQGCKSTIPGDSPP